MRHSCADVNRIHLHGRLGGTPAFSHSNHGADFFLIPLRVRRLSMEEDCLNVVVSQTLLADCGSLTPGDEVSIRGEVRTFNNRSGSGSRLIVNVLARELKKEAGEDENRLELSGTLCKAPSLRTTPLGRTICDLILAVNRRYGRADYLPCITWGSLAQRCGEKKVGDHLRLCGRLQSRTYHKVVDETIEERTAFEVSVMTLAPEGAAILP